MRVTPGKYQVKALSPGKTFVGAELSYENPDEVVVENGAAHRFNLWKRQRSLNNVKLGSQLWPTNLSSPS